MQKEGFNWTVGQSNQSTTYIFSWKQRKEKIVSVQYLREHNFCLYPQKLKKKGADIFLPFEYKTMPTPSN